MASTKAFRSSFPPANASRPKVQVWLAGWFTRRDLATSSFAPDVELKAILDNVDWDGYSLHAIPLDRLGAKLAANGMAKYVVEKLIDDVRAGKTISVCYILLILDLQAKEELEEGPWLTRTSTMTPDALSTSRLTKSARCSRIPYRLEVLELKTSTPG